MTYEPGHGENDCVTTKSLALAAYLKIKGFTLKDIDSTSYPAVFIFTEDDKIEEYKHAWFKGAAEGNINDFVFTYRQLLHKVKAYSECNQKEEAHVAKTLSSE